MTERTFEDIELDLKLFQIKLDNAENSKRLLQKLKNDVMELQIELLESLKLGDAYLTESEELEENNDFILTVNSETLSLEESYDNRINLVSKEIMDYENALDKLYYEKQSLMQKVMKEKEVKNGKVSVSSVGTQASTVAISMFSRVSALNDAITKLSSFAEAATLQGTAYSNAKSYATGTLTPMLQGMILFSETLSEKCTELQTLYVSICGDEDLDSVVLESKLASDRASLKIAEALLEHLNDDPEPSKSAISSTKSNIKKLKKRIKSNQKKLDNLNEFNAHSATVFADISNAQSTVNQALAAVSTGFSGYNSKTGAFGKPTSGQMEWTKTVKKNWKEREDAKAEELKSKKAEESKKASKIENTTKKSNVSVDKKKLIKAANEAYKLGEIKKDTYESIISGLSNASAALLKEVAKSKLTDTARLLM